MIYFRSLLHFEESVHLCKVLCHTRFRKKPQHGSRYLTDSDKVFDFNAWDNVTWDAEQESQAKEKVKENSSILASSSDQEKFEVDAAKYWNAFYDIHQNRFFKDRHWLFTEFPELAPLKVDSKTPLSVNCVPLEVTCTGEDSVVLPRSSVTCIEEKDLLAQQTRQVDSVECLSQNVGSVCLEEEKKTSILEIGCGVGNTVLPILQYNNDPNLSVFCCDISPTAIQILKDTPGHDPKRCHAFVYDIAADDDQPLPFPVESLDIAVLIFVLSAIHPEKMQLVVKRIYQYLRPGGLVVFRDYGRFDMAQLRFKKGRCLSDNFYARGDGTRVYFFTQEELKSLFESAGFLEEQNLVDRRLQVNRGKLLKMYRVWIQAKFRKPATPCAVSS